MEFTAGSCIRFGWETFKKRPWFFIGSFVVYILVLGLIIGILTALIGQTTTLTAALAGLVRSVVEIIAGICSISFFLKAHDDPEHVSMHDFLNFHPFWNYIGASLLFTLVFVCGLALLIVPGIIWGIMFGFTVYIVVDQKKGPIEAMKESARITQGHKWDLFVLGVLSVLIVLLGVVCLLVGILVATPVTGLAFVHAYRLLQNKTSTPQVVV